MDHDEWCCRMGLQLIRFRENKRGVDCYLYRIGKITMTGGGRGG